MVLYDIDLIYKHREIIQLCAFWIVYKQKAANVS